MPSVRRVENANNMKIHISKRPYQPEWREFKVIAMSIKTNENKLFASFNKEQTEKLITILQELVKEM